MNADSVKKDFVCLWKWRPTFFELATTLKNLRAKWLSEKKVNFTPCTCWKGNFIHSHTQELAESLVQDSNDNNKDNVKKSHFSLINNSIVLKSLMICPFWWALMGVITLKDWSIMRMSLDLIDTAYNGSYFTISL